MAVMYAMMDPKIIDSMSPEQRQFIMEKMELAVYEAFTKDRNAMDFMRESMKRSFEQLGTKAAFR